MDNPPPIFTRQLLAALVAVFFFFGLSMTLAYYSVKDKEPVIHIYKEQRCIA